MTILHISGSAWTRLAKIFLPQRVTQSALRWTILMFSRNDRFSFKDVLNVLGHLSISPEILLHVVEIFLRPFVDDSWPIQINQSLWINFRAIPKTGDRFRSAVDKGWVAEMYPWKVHRSIACFTQAELLGCLFWYIFRPPRNAQKNAFDASYLFSPQKCSNNKTWSTTSTRRSENMKLGSRLEVREKSYDRLREISSS